MKQCLTSRYPYYTRARYVCCALSFALLLGCTTNPGTLWINTFGSESQKLNAFFAKHREESRRRWPEWLTSSGFEVDNDKWNDRSEKRLLDEHAHTVNTLATLREKFDYARLEPTAQVSYKLFERDLQRATTAFPFRHHNYPVNHVGGPHTSIPLLLINQHPIDNRRNALAYIARLNGVADVMEQVIEGIDIRAAKGIIPPRFVFSHVAEAIDGTLIGAPFDASGFDNDMLANFKEKTAKLNLSAQDTARLHEQARHALLSSVGPGYKQLAMRMAELQQDANDDAGVWKFPDGDRYYALALATQTTTDLTPDAVHQLGLAEVARIHGEMRKIVSTIAFDGSLFDFFAFARTDPSNFYANDDQGREQYLADTRNFISGVRATLGDYFLRAPTADLVVSRVESFREANAPLGFYSPAPLHDNKPAIFYVNLHDMNLMPRSHMEALAYHEAIPGHHMQIALAQEIRDLPKFRTRGGFGVYAEGWALYAERLAKEMGFYKEPLSDFGRLAWELLRAARLVVDTGIHAKRWTRERAIAYLDKNLPVSHDTNVKAIERYIVWPAQATTYTIGLHKFLALRERAEDELGARFDIREFHEAVLENGSLPLDLLDEHVEQWLQAKQTTLQ